MWLSETSMKSPFSSSSEIARGSDAGAGGGEGAVRLSETSMKSSNSSSSEIATGSYGSGSGIGLGLGSSSSSSEEQVSLRRRLGIGRVWVWVWGLCFPPISFYAVFEVLEGRESGKWIRGTPRKRTRMLTHGPWPEEPETGKPWARSARSKGYWAGPGARLINIELHNGPMATLIW